MDTEFMWQEYGPKIYELVNKGSTIAHAAKTLNIKAVSAYGFFDSYKKSKQKGLSVEIPAQTILYDAKPKAIKMQTKKEILPQTVTLITGTPLAVAQYTKALNQ